MNTRLAVINRKNVNKNNSTLGNKRNYCHTGQVYSKQMSSGNRHYGSDSEHSRGTAC